MKNNQALAAAAIRKELKGIFPNIKFSVTSKGYSMGDHVNITWVDGPTQKEVDGIVSKYQYGHFDGMTDCYNSTNNRDDIPQSKYVHAQRDLSPEAEQKIIESLNRYGVIADQGFNRDKWYEDFHCYGSNLIYRESLNLSL